MRWHPQTRLGKISFWIGISAFALLYLQYWAAMLLRASLPPVSGIIVVVCIIAAGIGSALALVKGDKAILLFISAATGLLGVLLVIGELLFPH